MKRRLMNIAVLASGNGSNFEALVRAVRRGYVKAHVRLLVTDVPHAYVRTRARRFGIPEICVDPALFTSQQAHERKVIEILTAQKIDLIVLAGYMRLLSGVFVRAFPCRIVNIHPALLPAFKGTNAIERAYAYGCKVTGVTVHLVDERVDHGPIILQQSLPILPGESCRKLETRIHALEHRLYPQALKLLVEKKYRIKGRCVQSR